MPRAKSAPRVTGPYAERGGTRFRVRICDEAGRHDQYFSSLKEAQAAKRQAESELSKTSAHRISDAVAAYYRERVEQGMCLEQSAHDKAVQLSGFLGDYIDQDFGKLTAKRAAALYEHVVETPMARTGKPPSAATHRCYLGLAQTFFCWAVQKGYAPRNPFAEVRPVGRVSCGKKQLRFEEASRFISSGLQLFDQDGDMLALAGVTTLLLGCRATEVLHVKVRDLDCGGTKLWIAARDSEYRGKTSNAARSPDVPPVLQPRLVKLAEGKPAADYLFGLGRTGKPRRRQTLHKAVRRICQAAGVPVVCTHSLRGLWATAGVRSGALSHAVAAALGHGSFSMTRRHYVEPGTVEGTQTEQLVKLLDLSDPQQDAEKARVTAEQLLASLPTETLIKLVDLVGAGLAGKAKEN